MFCHPIDDGDDADDQTVDLADGTARKNVSGRRKVSPSTMAFSLALAGSVMVTVSVVSIGPECLAASSMQLNSQISGLDDENSFFVFGITLMPIFSWVFLTTVIICSRLVFVLSNVKICIPRARRNFVHAF